MNNTINISDYEWIHNVPNGIYPVKYWYTPGKLMKFLGFKPRWKHGFGYIEIERDELGTFCSWMSNYNYHYLLSEKYAYNVYFYKKNKRPFVSEHIYTRCFEIHDLNKANSLVKEILESLQYLEEYKQHIMYQVLS